MKFIRKEIKKTAMKIKKYYLKADSRKLGLSFWVATWLLMDRLNAPEWLYGIYWFIVGVFALDFIYSLCKYEEVQVDAQDILKSWHLSKEAETKPDVKQGWQSRYDELNKEWQKKNNVGKI